MAKELKLRRGTTTEHSTFTGAEGEVTVDTTKDTVVVHDGVTAGGVPLAKESDIPTGALASLNEVDASTIADNSVGAAELNVSGNGTAGQYLASDGDGTMTWTTLAAGGGFSNMQVFTSPGTWTNPGSVEKVKVTVVGGGGGTANITGPAPFQGWGSGGGGGGAAIEVISFPSATNVPVTIGSGGTTVNNGTGNSGGTSSFGSYCSATGGTGGGSANAGWGYSNPLVGSGGTGSGGNLNLRGNAGVAYGNNPGASSGSGGGSIFGGGGRGRAYADNMPGSVPGQPGLYGGGGGGAHKQSSSSTATGGSGGSGVVVVEY